MPFSQTLDGCVLSSVARFRVSGLVWRVGEIRVRNFVEVALLGASVRMW